MDARPPAPFGMRSRVRVSSERLRRYRRSGWMLALVVLLSALYSPVVANDTIERAQRDSATGRAEAFLDEGRLQLERGAYVRAVRVLSEAIKKGAGPEAYKFRGEAYLALGLHSEAIDDLTRYAQSGAGRVDGLILRGDARNERGDYSEAFTDFTAAIKQDPLRVDAYLGRALTLLAQEKYAAAMKDLQVVLEKDPNNVEALTNLGFACEAADLPGSAREYFQKVLEVETSLQWTERIDARLREAPESSAFERKIGGLSGFLSRVATARTAEDGSGQSDVAAGEKAVSHQQIGRTRRDEQFLSKKLLELRRTVDREADAEKPVFGKVSGSEMGFGWTFDFQVKGRQVTGTLRIVGPAGLDETHHCSGSYDRGFVDLSDRKGHRFQGRITEDLRLEGRLTTNYGTSYVVNVPLSE